MARISFAKQVRDSLAELTADSGKAATTDEISIKLRLMTHTDHKRLINTLSEMSRDGKIERTGKGMYKSIQRNAKPTICERMWSVLRMRKRVNVEDLMVMAGASNDYAKEWLRALERQDVVAKQGEGNLDNCTWVLIKDTINMPQNDAKADRLRDLRKSKKDQAMAQLLRGTASGLHTIAQGLRDAANTLENNDEQ